MSNEPQPRPNRERKREQFVGASKANRKPVTLLILLVIIAAGGYIAWKVLNNKPEATTVTSSPQATSPSPGQSANTNANAAAGASNQSNQQEAVVRIPLADLSDKAKFFQYPASDGRTVRFFAVKLADGTCRTALDACDVCYHAKKGYRQQGSEMVCNNCGLPFAIARIGTVVGGCNPVGLPSTLDGSQLVIRSSELESRANYF